MKELLFVILTLMVVFSFNCPVLAQTEAQSVPATVQSVPAEAQSVPETTQSLPATDQKGPSVGMQILDVALVRPLCVVGSTVSTATYIAISPLVFVMGLGEPAARVMVEAPWRFTAFRYVGDFSHYRDEQPIMGVWDF